MRLETLRGTTQLACTIHTDVARSDRRSQRDSGSSLQVQAGGPFAGHQQKENTVDSLRDKTDQPGLVSQGGSEEGLRPGPLLQPGD